MTLVTGMSTSAAAGARTPDAGVSVVIAVKRLTAAKTRLAPAFSPATRGGVVLAMLEDTIAAATAVPAVRSVIVVTPDADAAAAAGRLGAHALHDPTPSGHHDPLNHALTAGETLARRTGANVVALQ